MSNSKNKKLLTYKVIDSAKCEPDKAQSFIWDTDANGFGLRITSNGAKAFIFQAKLNGKTVRIKIGSPKDWQIDEARKEARSLRVLVDKGEDPRQIRAEKDRELEQKEQDEKNRSLVVYDLWDEYLKSNSGSWSYRHYRDHLNLAKKGGQKKKRGKGLTVDGVIYPLMQLKLSEVTAQYLIDWIKVEKAIRENNARQGFEAFRTFWRWCASRNEYKAYVDPSIVDSADLRKVIPKKKNKSMDTMDKIHMKAWFQEVGIIQNRVISAYLQVLLLVGARREELAEMRWCDVDFRWKSIWIKDKVKEEGRKIPLTPYVASLLNSLPKRNEWVFSSTASQSGRLIDPSSAHIDALKKAGIPHVTLHGLRRTFKNLVEWVEMPVGVVDQIQGHAPSAMAEKHYKHRPLDILAIYHTRYEKWIVELAGIDFDYESDVLPMRLISEKGFATH
jgi:integrase